MLMKSLGIQNLSLAFSKFIFKSWFSNIFILLESEDIEYTALSEENKYE